MGLPGSSLNECSEGLGMDNGLMEGEHAAPGASMCDIAGVSVGDGRPCTWFCPVLTTRLAIGSAWGWCCCGPLCRSGSGRPSNPRLTEAIASISEVWSIGGVFLSELV